MPASNQQLNNLIDHWCERHLSKGCSGVTSERIDELKDHLLCVAEAQIEQGTSVEEAVEFAVRQFGDPTEVREQLTSSSSSFRRWLASVHCNRPAAGKAPDRKIVIMSLIIAAKLLLSAWLAQDNRTYAFLSTTLIAVWVVLAVRMGGAREAARAEWRWLKRKFGG